MRIVAATTTGGGFGEPRSWAKASSRRRSLADWLLPGHERLSLIQRQEHPGSGRLLEPANASSKSPHELRRVSR